MAIRFLAFLTIFVRLPKKVFGIGPVELTIDAILNPKKFREEFLKEDEKLSGKSRLFARSVQIIVPRSGVIRNPEALEQIRKLPSFFSLNYAPTIGSRVSRTEDLFTSPGQIQLVHENLQTLEADYRKIRALESQDFYGAF